jgi:hypothetical protein
VYLFNFNQSVASSRLCHRTLSHSCAANPPAFYLLCLLPFLLTWRLEKFLKERNLSLTEFTYLSSSTYWALNKFLLNKWILTKLCSQVTTFQRKIL